LTLLAPLEGQELPKAMRKLFNGKQYKNYQWADYPLDDYGVGTAYKGAGAGSFLCATFQCLNVARPDVSKPDGLSQWLTVADAKAPEGYSAKGCGGPVQTTLNKNTSWAINALVPAMLSALNLTANASNDRTAKIQLSLSSACNRKLEQVKAIRYFTETSHPDTYGVRDAHNNNSLVLVLEDIVITSFDIQVTTNGQLKAGFDAKLQQDPTGKFGQNSELKFNLQKTNDTQYHLTSAAPVIVGFLAANNHDAPPLKGVAPGSSGDWEGWKPTTVVLPQRATAK
jgi:hypothetical protein